MKKEKKSIDGWKAQQIVNNRKLVVVKFTMRSSIKCKQDKNSTDVDSKRILVDENWLDVMLDNESLNKLNKLRRFKYLTIIKSRWVKLIDIK